MLLPDCTGSGESVFVTETSAEGASVSVSVALLLPGVGSVTPPGAVTVAVLINDPVADAEMLQLAVYVTLPPLGRPTELLILPDPDAAAVPPPDTHKVNEQVKAAGNVSATVEAGALLGPGFE